MLHGVHSVLDRLVLVWTTGLFMTATRNGVQGVPLLQMEYKSPVVTTVGTDIKLSCTAMQWTEGFTITWSRNSTGEVLSKNLHIVADPSRYSVTTVISSELESTTWTLTIKDAIQSDSGEYVCAIKTEPPQFVAFLVFVQVPVITDIPSEAVRWDVSDCCSVRQVPTFCQPLCNTKKTGFDVSDALRLSERCRQHHDPWFKCLANERDHTPCCKRRHVPDKCTPLCLGNFSTVLNSGHLDCLHFAAVIFQCFHEGRESIPSPPRSLRVANLGMDSLRVWWSPPLKNGRDVNYTVIYKALGKLDPGLKRAGGLTRTVSTTALGLILSDLSPGEAYKIHVVALNGAGSSQASESAMVDLPVPIHIMSKMLEDGILTPASTKPETTTEVTAVTTTTLEALTTGQSTSTEVSVVQTVDTSLQDDFVAFEKCFETEEFRSSCSPVFKDNRAGRNNVVVRCRDSLPRFVACASDGADHRKCCQRNVVPDRCLDLCAGRPAGLFDVCHNFLPRILGCFKEGQLFLPSAPLLVSAEYRDTQIIVQWHPPNIRPEMVENYVVVIEDRKSGTVANWTVPRDNHSLIIDPSTIASFNEISIQAESFHGLSAKSAPVVIDSNEIASSFEQNIMPDSSNQGPAVAIGLSVVGLTVVLCASAFGFYYKRKQILNGRTIETEPENGPKLRKPINAFYIPGYFGRRDVVPKQSTGSSDYATSFTMKRSQSRVSEAVYSDASGQYLWMFGKGENPSGETYQNADSRSDGEDNSYDNHIPSGSRS